MDAVAPVVGQAEAVVEGMCTNIKFNFKSQKWSDGLTMEEPDFIRKWKNRFGLFWDNWKGYQPNQPHIPVIAIVGYTKIPEIDVLHQDRLYPPYTVAFESLSDEDIQRHFICHNRSSFKYGTYKGNLERTRIIWSASH